MIDAHRGDRKRFIVRADEKLTAFLELERAICVRLLTEQIWQRITLRRFRCRVHPQALQILSIRIDVPGWTC